MTTKTKTKTVSITGDLLTIAKRIGTTIKNADKLAITLGKLARDAAPKIKDEKTLDAFITECRKQCKGASDASTKTYLSMVRGVLRAAVDGWTLPDDDSIKVMYKDAPKGKGSNRGGTGKPRNVEKEKRDAAPKAKTITIEDAVRIIFGHADDELIAALEWARQNEVSFIRYVKANIAAAATAEVVAKAKSAAKTRQRKAA